MQLSADVLFVSIMVELAHPMANHLAAVVEAVASAADVVAVAIEADVVEGGVVEALVTVVGVAGPAVAEGGRQIVEDLETSRARR